MKTGTRPDTWRHTRAPLQDQTHTGTPGTRPDTWRHTGTPGTRPDSWRHTGTPSGRQIWHPGTRPASRSDTHGHPWHLQGTGGIFAPDPGGRGRGGATTVAAASAAALLPGDAPRPLSIPRPWRLPPPRPKP